MYKQSYGLPLTKIAFALCLVVGAFAMSGCSKFAPDAGHEIVLVKKPWIFGHGGVHPEPVKTGLAFGAITTKGVDVYMQPVRYMARMDDAMTSDGVPIDFDAVAVLQVTDSVKLISNFGENWYKNNLEAPFRTMIRQAVRKRGMNETAISSEAIEEVDAEVQQGLESFIKEVDLPVRIVTLTVGKANPPDSVKNQRIETAAQQQRIQTELQRKLAEDARLQAEEARAAADNAYREYMHLSPEQFLQLETIKMQAEICGKDGKATCTFIQNGVAPVYNLAK